MLNKQRKQVFLGFISHEPEVRRGQIGEAIYRRTFDTFLNDFGTIFEVLFGIILVEVWSKY